jgi:hypothetical protein
MPTAARPEKTPYRQNPVDLIDDPHDDVEMRAKDRRTVDTVTPPSDGLLPFRKSFAAGCGPRFQ